LEVNCGTFWEYIETYPNFSKMFQAINDPDTIKELILYLRDGQWRGGMALSIKNNLIKANVCKLGPRSTTFATPFVQVFVERKIRQITIEPQNVPLQSMRKKDGKDILRVDVPTLVRMVAQHMNRSNIILVQKKKNMTNQSKTAESGPKEIVYVNQFHETMRLLFPSDFIK
jgi:hypothetical protein